jgi:hypothetical protein
MQTPNRWLWGLFVGAFAAAPGAAQAGAWSADDQTIVGAALGERKQGRYYEADLYHEQALTARFGLVGQARLDSADLYEPSGWRGDGQAAIKWSVLSSGQTALALQGGALWSHEPSAACDGLGAEARALAGRSVGDVFVNIEAAYRAQDGGCHRGRYDLSIGWRPATNWLGLGQVFVDRDLSLGENGQQTVKLQLSAVSFVSKLGGLQLGYRAGLGQAAGDNALVLGWWSRK